MGPFVLVGGPTGDWVQLWNTESEQMIQGHSFSNRDILDFIGVEYTTVEVPAGEHEWDGDQFPDTFEEMDRLQKGTICADIATYTLIQITHFWMAR